MTNFIDQALVFIGSSVLLVPIFHKLGFGSVIGYLIAGMLVGPFGLRFIEDGESILHFAELGVVILLFIIGLEIQPRKLWSMKKNLLGLGGTQILFSSLIFAVVGYQLKIGLLTSFVIGFALSLSSTAFALQTLSEKKQLKTEFGEGSFSILLMQDLLAVPILVAIPMLLTDTGKDQNFVQTLLFIPAFLIFAVVANRFIMRPIFKIVADTRAKEIFTATTLFIVLGVASVMVKFGLSAALGTFIAGMLLSDSEYRHELEANLDPFKSLLMGLFFIAVGIGVRLDLVFDEPLKILALTLSYMLLKMIIIYGVGKSFRMNHQNSKMMALNLAQGGEFAFVIFGVIQEGKAVPLEVMNILTVVVTISMALNPLISLLVDFFGKLKTTPQIIPRYDEIKDESPKVIVAGYGRFGQMIGRVLKFQSIPFVAVDHDSDQIELVRRFGTKVYYGDASRMDILESAGAKKASFIVLAIDDVEVSIKTARLITEHFPHIEIFARARNRGHVFELMELGIKEIKRETFDSSISFAGDLLVRMGMNQERASQLIEKFKIHDEQMLQKQFLVRTDDKEFVSVSNQSMAQLAQVLQDESQQSFISPGK